MAAPADSADRPRLALVSDAVADWLQSEANKSGRPQMTLFGEEPPAKKRSKKAAGKRGQDVPDDSLRGGREATTLDRIHMAMLLQASGRSNALGSLLETEQSRGPDFVRLANALSALYPAGSEEKRLIDAMLLRGEPVDNAQARHHCQPVNRRNGVRIGPKGRSPGSTRGPHGSATRGDSGGVLSRGGHRRLYI